jgi:hypothetical protein
MRAALRVFKATACFAATPDPRDIATIQRFAGPLPPGTHPQELARHLIETIPWSISSTLPSDSNNAGE